MMQINTIESMMKKKLPHLFKSFINETYVFKKFFDKRQSLQTKVMSASDDMNIVFINTLCPAEHYFFLRQQNLM